MRQLAYTFRYKGGVVKPGDHEVEKFLLFFVMEGQEIPFYQMQKESLLVRVKDTDPEWQTANNVMKLFVGQQGFNVPRRFYSFFLRLEENAPLVTVKPFSLDRTGMFFQAQAKFLSNKDAIELIDEDSQSRKFVAKQGLLPLNVLRSMVTVDRTILRKGVRAMRIGQQKKKGEAL